MGRKKCRWVHPPRAVIHARAVDRLPARTLRRQLPRGYRLSRCASFRSRMNRTSTQRTSQTTPRERRPRHADLSSQRMNAKIRSAQLMKVPYMLVVGKNEMEAGCVSCA
ncbi:MAG: His/Gly/Thr/Pro-type tRNA ligase C-terminal domain-containing protein [Anaerolineales bacterium]